MEYSQWWPQDSPLRGHDRPSVGATIVAAIGIVTNTAERSFGSIIANAAGRPKLARHDQSSGATFRSLVSRSLAVILRARYAAGAYSSAHVFERSQGRVVDVAQPRNRRRWWRRGEVPTSGTRTSRRNEQPGVFRRLQEVPEWRNWQTRGTQNPVRLKPRVGSTPTSGTIFATTYALGMRCASRPPFADCARIVLILETGASETRATCTGSPSAACIAATFFTPSARSRSDTMA